MVNGLFIGRAKPDPLLRGKESAPPPKGHRTVERVAVLTSWRKGPLSILAESCGNGN